MSESKAVLLAKLVRRAWERDDAGAMRLFGNNTTQMLANDVELSASVNENSPAQEQGK